MTILAYLLLVLRTPNMIPGILTAFTEFEKIIFIELTHLIMVRINFNKNLVKIV